MYLRTFCIVNNEWIAGPHAFLVFCFMKRTKYSYIYGLVATLSEVFSQLICFIFDWSNCILLIFANGDYNTTLL